MLPPFSQTYQSAEATPPKVFTDDNTQRPPLVSTTINNQATSPMDPNHSQGQAPQAPSAPLPSPNDDIRPGFSRLFDRAREGPNGWNFQNIKHWTELSPDWWFVPKANLQFLTREYLLENLSVEELLEVQEAIESGATNHDNLAALASAKNHDRLLFFGLIEYFHGNFDTSMLGNGFVIDATTTPFQIIGCYKTFNTFDPHGAQDYRTEVSALKHKADEKDREIDVIETAASYNETGRPSRGQKTQITNRTKHKTEFMNQIRRLRGLVADLRPYAIALHEPPMFEISSLMNGERLAKFGGPYSKFLSDFKQAMGDVIVEAEDLPAFELAKRTEVDEEEDEEMGDLSELD